jgi:hypothetical protein
VFLGALTVDPAHPTNTASRIYHRPLQFLQLPATAKTTTTTTTATNTVLNNKATSWTRVGNTGGPPNLDDDAMPKDRMALQAHPSDPTLLFVAGNGDQIAYRVKWENGTWESLSDADDTTDGSAPHCDCRNFLWADSSSGSGDGGGGDTDTAQLLLVSDGGVFGRTRPETKGAGKWQSLNGDIGVMEVSKERARRESGFIV